MTSPPTNNKKTGLGRVMLAGAAWAIAMRWSMRLLGLVSVVILARLLTPADFGIVAMATLAIALIDSLSEFGTDMVLLRQAEATREHCDTAWTFRLLQGIVTAVLIVAATPLVASYFDEPRLPFVMVVLALCAIVVATGNIGMTLVRKELKFAIDFRFGLYKKLAEFGPTIALAYWLRDYRALVLGTLIGACAGVAISYRMHPYRPRFSLIKYKEYLAFSIDVVASNIARLLKNKVDVLVLGGTAGAAATGSYNVASELARMGTQEIVIPAWRGLFPSFAALRHDQGQFVAAYARFVGVVAALCLPLGLGLWALAADVVHVLLGAQWGAAIVPLQWLALGAALLALVDTFGGSILFASGHERRAAVLIWIHVALLAPAVILASRAGGVEGVALASMVVAAAMVPLAAFVVVRSLRCPLWLIVDAVWRPLLASVVMGVALQWLAIDILAPGFLRLLVKALIGATLYGAIIALLWWVAGKPPGIERTALDWVKARMSRRTAT